MQLVGSLLVLVLTGTSIAACQDGETLPALNDREAPRNLDEMWTGFDPRGEPLGIELLEQWEEDGVVLQVLRYRIGVFKGRKAMMAAVYGYPKGRSNLPGLVQIHGGGQYADHRACLANAKRGYATISIAWAGRVSAPNYRVTPVEVKLFWEGKTDDPRYKLTTDWGAVDGYHAPGRNAGNVFPSAKAAAWTLDDVESPRNSGWYLCALAARRALTFLERQPEVDPDRLGVYGHSMGGKLSVMTAVDSRVKAVAPSCGGISDRHNKSGIYRGSLGDDVSLREVSCPILFLCPSNDFHGHIGDLPKAVAEINTDQWRVTCAPHHNHQDTPPYEVATMLWMDQHLRGCFSFPQIPETTLVLKTDDGVPRFRVRPDRAGSVLAVDIFFTQQGNAGDGPEHMESIIHRFWHHAEPVESDRVWTAKLPLSSVKQPLWVYANVTYPLDEPVSGVGYYYGTYTAESFIVSSLLQVASPADLAATGTRATREPSLLIESFEGDWEEVGIQPEAVRRVLEQFRDGSVPETWWRREHVQGVFHDKASDSEFTHGNAPRCHVAVVGNGSIRFDSREPCGISSRCHEDLPDEGREIPGIPCGRRADRKGGLPGNDGTPERDHGRVPGRGLQRSGDDGNVPDRDRKNEGPAVFHLEYRV